ncbi:MAG: hypothetical protein ACTSRA_12625 [Promethearchaeota archaeon]
MQILNRVDRSYDLISHRVYQEYSYNYILSLLVDKYKKSVIQKNDKNRHDNHPWQRSQAGAGPDLPPVGYIKHLMLKNLIKLKMS